MNPKGSTDEPFHGRCRDVGWLEPGLSPVEVALRVDANVRRFRQPVEKALHGAVLEDFAAVLARLAEFLAPPLLGAAGDPKDFGMNWSPGHGWNP